MRALRLWLTRRPDGLYMLTRLRPVIARRKGSRDLDVYEAVGEPIGVRHLCAEGIRAVGWVLPPLEPRRVLFTLAPEEPDMATSASYRMTIGPVTVSKIEDGVKRAFWQHKGSEYANMAIEDVLLVQSVLHESEGKLLAFDAAPDGGKKK